jgi:hypothetical protein
MSDFTSRDFKTPEQHEFYKKLRSVEPYSVQFYHLFEDFLTLAHAALYQPAHRLVTGKINDEIEAEYMRTIRKYKREKASLFSECLGMVTNALEKDYHDFLGDVAAALSVTNHWACQYWTPKHLCTAMVKMTVQNRKPTADHRFTVGEPCVGGGAMLIAMAEELRRLNYHPVNWWFEATDIDRHCCQMAYIQLTLCGAPGIVTHGNSLSMETWASWPTMTGAMFPHYWPKQDKPFVSCAKMRQMELNLQEL